MVDLRYCRPPIQTRSWSPCLASSFSSARVADKPTDHGFRNDLWTAGRLADLIRRPWGVRYPRTTSENGWQSADNPKLHHHFLDVRWAMAVVVRRCMKLVRSAGHNSVTSLSSDTTRTLWDATDIIRGTVVALGFQKHFCSSDLSPFASL